MRDFALLYAELDETTSTTRKLNALQQYFRTAAPADAAWAVYFPVSYTHLTLPTTPYV